MAKATRKLVPREDRVTINHEFGSVDAFIREYVTNISRSGVFIKTKKPLPVGTKVNLRFSVIMDELETIEGIGEVVRNQDEPSGMGVVFVTLTSHSQDLISKLITARRSSRPPAAVVPPAVEAAGSAPATPDDPPRRPGTPPPVPPAARKGKT